MNRTPSICRRNPLAFRLACLAGIGLSTAILCSCRGGGSPQYAQAPASPYAWPPVAMAGAPHAAMSAPQTAPGMENGIPVPFEPRGPWNPPGTSGPWPEDEYLRDGGDSGLAVALGDQWKVHGLEMEDTIAHYEMLDGKTKVEPSNQVHIYSPRFGAVRQVVSLVANEQHDRSSGVSAPQKLTRLEETQKFQAAKQNVQALADTGARPATVMRSRQGDGVMSSAVKAKAFQDAFKPYENLSIIRQGVMESSEMAVLARGAQAALVWTNNQATQVVIDNQRAMAEVSNQKVDTLFTIQEPPANAKLRVVKVASTQFAEPGDVLDFTIRFDNVGNQLIGNVTILDSLNTRLEYVPDSAQCSIDAKFLFEPNEGDSVVVRCEVAEPLKPGDGGVIRFQCKVR